VQPENKNLKERITGRTIVSALGLIGALFFPSIWEMSQPSRQIYGRILSVEYRGSLKGDLHFGTRGNYKILVEGEDYPIVFPSKRWEKNLKRGDYANLTIKRSFPLFGQRLEGLRVNP